MADHRSLGEGGQIRLTVVLVLSRRCDERAAHSPLPLFSTVPERFSYFYQPALPLGAESLNHGVQPYLPFLEVAPIDSHVHIVVVLIRECCSVMHTSVHK